MSTDQITFSKELLKGRIAETIFEQMFGEAGCFTILKFGYENILPEIAHHQNFINGKQTLEIIRRAPDFAVIDNHSKKNQVFLIEVKFQKIFNPTWALEAAQKMMKSWSPAYLFIVTPNGFYMNMAADVINVHGVMNNLSHPCVSLELQDKYLKLLNEFIIVSKP